MIRDIDTTVKTDKGTYNIVVTGAQITQTIQRRMATLAPKERVLDIVENVQEVAQTDSSRAAKAR